MADEQPKTERPLNELLSHSLVDIYVGPDHNHWPLHEKLLTTRSSFFAKIFRTTRSFGLPDDSDGAFSLFVGWLYSGRIPAPADESALTELLELALMGERWAIAALVSDVLDAVREFYARTDTYPGLRRVQYVYANTEPESPMRAMLVGAVARMLVLRKPEDGLPRHWDKALRKNGQLAVDIIAAVQGWRLGEGVGEAKVPDARKKVGAMEVEGVKKVEIREGEVEKMDPREVAMRGAMIPASSEEQVGKVDVGRKKEELERGMKSEGEDSVATLVDGAH